MPIGDAGTEQFRNAVLEVRNHHIAAMLQPLMELRMELVNSEDLRDRGGLDTPSRDHFMELLGNADRWRRRLTHNPDNADLGGKIAKAIDAEQEIADAENPFGGDEVQMGATALYEIPWAMDGTDSDIPINSQLKLTGNGRILLGAIDTAIVAITRLASKDRSRFVTRHDSLRVYGLYQQIFAYLMTFAGDENRVDVAQLPADEEPRGPSNAPNRISETATGTGS